jgi:hypothetical protein
MTLIEGLQAISIVILAFYAIKTSQMASETKRMAEETKRMADDVKAQRRQETIKDKILFSLNNGIKTAEKISEETGIPVEDILPAIGRFRGPFGIIETYGYEEGKMRFKYKERT